MSQKFNKQLFSFQEHLLLVMCQTKLQAKLSIVLVTSPIASHPSTELLEKVVSSFKLVPELSSCRLVIIGDGVKLGKFRPKRGSVTSEMIDNYRTYLTNIEQMIANASSDSIWSNTSLIRMPEHVGFGHAVYHGLKMCQTEYVMVVQHDHPFSLSFRYACSFI